MEDFNFHRLPFFAGCQSCGASLAPYNAYPTRTGYISCKDCLCEELGFHSVADFDRFQLKLMEDN